MAVSDRQTQSDCRETPASASDSSLEYWPSGPTAILPKTFKLPYLAKYSDSVTTTELLLGSIPEALDKTQSAAEFNGLFGFFAFVSLRDSSGTGTLFSRALVCRATEWI